MKQILRIFGVVSIVLLVTLITALSCNKDDKSNNNNNSGGSGGSGDGGSGGGGGGGIDRATIPWDCGDGATKYTGPIEVSKAPGAGYGSVDIKSNIDNCIYVTIEGGTHGWGAFATNNEDDFNTGIRRYFYGTTELLSRDFINIEYTGANGGLVVVIDGTWDPTKLTIPFTGDPPGYGIKEGVHINTVKRTTNNINYIDEHTAHNRSVRKEGLNIFSAFIDENKYFPKISFDPVTPTGLAPNPKHNVVEGFPPPAPLNNIPDLQPRIFCHTVVPAITQIPQKADLSDFSVGAIRELLGWNLTGGQKTTCRASSASTPYVEKWSVEEIIVGKDPVTGRKWKSSKNVPAMAWMQAAEQTNLNAWATKAKAQNKNEIRLRIVGVRTDNEPVGDILPGADARAQFAPLVGGVTPANQASIRTNILAKLQASTGNPNLKLEDISESVGLVIRIKTP